MTTVPVSVDGQAIALACSTLALDGNRSIKPLSATEWHGVSLALRSSELERPRDLIGLTSRELRQALALDPALADRLAALLARGGQLAFELERLASRGIWVLTRADDGYPALLKQRLRGQSPPVLFGAGTYAAFDTPGIAVVGSRDVDAAGLSWAASLGQGCAGQGVTVVSGAARGVDITAMNAALSAGGRAIGVTVEPLDRLVGRREVREFVLDETLTLLTPFHPSARWQAGNAMRRNRLIYALSRAAVVVASSAEKGGTRAGALENLRGGWVPLHVRDDQSPGNARLIAEGGRPLSAGEPVDDSTISRLLRTSTIRLDGDGEVGETPETGALFGIGESRGAAETSAWRLSTDDLRTPIRADVFAVVWPMLATCLQRPLTEREVAERLKLELTQARTWLKRAVEEGLADAIPRPKRYVVRGGDAAQLRIDAP
jgi:predicted Rossmann fold nucleotide-binding protein DprA/Smf involved in DNA uptake